MFQLAQSSRWRQFLRVAFVLPSLVILYYIFQLQYSPSVRQFTPRPIVPDRQEQPLLNPTLTEIKYYEEPSQRPTASAYNEEMLGKCDETSLRGLDDVFVILKTGANEAPEKLPPHFNTTLRCLPHYGIWSDLSETIGGHDVLDALDNMDPQIVANHVDFEYYRQLQEKGRDAFSPEDLAKWSSAPNTNSGKDIPGWKLDKWKFLPIAAKAYATRPEAKWFVFLECDSYMSWRNLVAWVSQPQMDASRQLYLGQPMQIGDMQFAYGGSGFLISSAAMKLLVDYRERNLQSLDDFTGKHWAGDCVLGKAMADAGVSLSWVWPTLFSEKPNDMNFGEFSYQKHLWCHYVTSYHHMLPAEMVEFYQFEQGWNRGNNSLLRQSDVFRNFVLPRMAPKVDGWDNLSTDDEQQGTTVDSCRSVCENKPDCMQWSFSGQTCKTSRGIKLGHAQVIVVSGWIMDRVEAFMRREDKECTLGEDWALP